MGADSSKQTPPVNEDRNLRRRRSLFMPLAQNRRLNKIDYLIIAGSKIYSKAAEAFHSSLKEFDHNFSKSKVFENFNVGFQGKTFSQILNEFLSSSSADGFVIYFAGNISEEKLSMVIESNLDSKIESDQPIIKANPKSSQVRSDLQNENADSKNSKVNSNLLNSEQQKINQLTFRELFSKWKGVDKRDQKHLLLILDSKNSGVLNLEQCAQNPAPFEKYEDHFGLPWKGSQLIIRKDATFSIITSSISTIPVNVNSSPSIQELAKVKGFYEQANEEIPYFFGYEIKAYHDFGVYFWVDPKNMMNQQNINKFVSKGLPLKGSNKAETKVIEVKMQHPHPKGEYFGFMTKAPLKNQIFGNPQIGSQIKVQSQTENMGSKSQLDSKSIALKKTTPRIDSNTSILDDKNDSHLQNNPFRSAIFDGKQQELIRKYYGHQEFNLDEKNKLEVYEGFWNNNQFSNYGCFRYSNGARYEGEYNEGIKDGYGVYRSPKGQIYSGQFKQNEIEGIGRLVLNENQIYAGNFKKGKREGYGILFCQKDRNIMLKYGQWKDNMQEGKGRICFNSIPNIEMETDYSANMINGDVSYNIVELPDKIKDEQRLTILSAYWFNNRRITPYKIISKSNDSKIEESQLQSYQKRLEEFEDLHGQFVYPIIPVAKDIEENYKLILEEKDLVH